MLFNFEDRIPHAQARICRVEISTGALAVLSFLVLALVIITTGSGPSVASFVQEVFRAGIAPADIPCYESFEPPKPKGFWWF